MYGSVALRPRFDVVFQVCSLDTVTIGIILALWAASVAIQMRVKDLVSVTAFGHKEAVLCPSALLVTGVSNGMASAVCFALVYAAKAGFACAPAAGQSGEGESREAQSFTWPQLAMLLVVGVFEGGERGLQNKSFEYLDIATRTMVCSTGLLFTLAIARACGLELVNPPRVASVLVLVLGGCLQGVGMHGGRSSVEGVVLAVLSLLAGSCRWVTMQVLLNRTSDRPLKPNNLTKIKMIAFMKPVDCFFCLMLSWLWEHTDFTAITGQVLVACLINAVLIIVTVVCDIAVISRISAVGLGVVMTLFSIPLVLAGVILDKEHVTLWQISGFAVCVVGSLIYFRERARESASLATNAGLKDGDAC